MSYDDFAMENGSKTTSFGKVVEVKNHFGATIPEGFVEGVDVLPVIKVEKNQASYDAGLRLPNGSAFRETVTDFDY